MTDWKEFVDHYLPSLKSDDDAFHSLLEADSAVIPHLIESYQQTDDTQLQTRLVEVVWQHRESSSLPFLLTALKSSTDGTWKAALDGVVAIGGQSAIEGIQGVLPSLEGEKVRWVEEALEQVRGRKA